MKQDRASKREERRRRFAAECDVPAFDILLTLDELAYAFGCTKQACQAWKSHPAFPYKSGAPFTRSRIERWHNEFIGGRSGKVDLTLAQREKRISIAMKLERAKLLKITRLEREGKLFGRVWHENAMVNIANWVRAELQDLIDGVPSRFRESVKMREALIEWDHGFWTRISARLDDVYDPVPKTTGDQSPEKDPKAQHAARYRHAGRKQA